MKLDAMDYVKFQNKSKDASNINQEFNVRFVNLITLKKVEYVNINKVDKAKHLVNNLIISVNVINVNEDFISIHKANNA